MLSELTRDAKGIRRRRVITALAVHSPSFFLSLSLPYNGLPYIPFLGGLDSPVKRRVNWISRKRSLSLVRSRRHLTPFHGRPPPPNCNRRTRGTDRRTNTYAAIPWAGHTQDEWRLDAIYKKRYVTYLLSTYSRNLLRRNPLMKTRYIGLRRISLHVRNALEGMSAESKKTKNKHKAEAMSRIIQVTYTISNLIRLYPRISRKRRGWKQIDWTNVVTLSRRTNITLVI